MAGKYEVWLKKKGKQLYLRRKSSDWRANNWNNGIFKISESEHVDKAEAACAPGNKIKFSKHNTDQHFTLKDPIIFWALQTKVTNACKKPEETFQNFADSCTM